jgi:peptidoglycan/LPS O-acetylase OafA/YrhL
VVGGLLAIVIGGLPLGRTLRAGAMALLQANSVNVPLGWLPYDPWGVTWSLSAEWVSYLLLPIVLLLARQLSVRRVAIVFAVAAVLFFAISLLLDPLWFYFGPVSRAAQVFAGGAVALATFGLAPTARSYRLVAPGAVLALAGIVAWVVRGYTEMQPIYRFVGFPMVTLAACVLVVAASFAANSAVVRLLSAAPLAAIGRVSYSLYLWHTVSFAILGSRIDHFPTITWQLLSLVLTLVATWFSYTYLEKPFMKSQSAALLPTATSQRREVAAE